MLNRRSRHECNAAKVLNRRSCHQCSIAKVQNVRSCHQCSTAKVQNVINATLLKCGIGKAFMNAAQLNTPFSRPQLRTSWLSNPNIDSEFSKLHHLTLSSCSGDEICLTKPRTNPPSIGESDETAANGLRFGIGVAVPSSHTLFKMQARRAAERDGLDLFSRKENHTSKTWQFPLLANVRNCCSWLEPKKKVLIRINLYGFEHKYLEYTVFSSSFLPLLDNNM